MSGERQQPVPEELLQMMDFLDSDEDFAEIETIESLGDLSEEDGLSEGSSK